MHAERLRRLYAAMFKCRQLDDAMHEEAQDRSSSGGLEAIISGAAIHLHSDDFVAPSPYEHFARAIQGVPVQAPGSALTRVESDTSNQLHLAAGMALACKLLGRASVTLCVSKIVQAANLWRPAVSFASQRKLPVLFVLAHSTGENQNAFHELRNEAQALLPAITVDGNDVVAVYRVAEESMRRARQGLGPSLIECRLEHGRDPLLFMETYLKNRNLWSDSWKQELTRNLERELTPRQKVRRKAV